MYGNGVGVKISLLARFLEKLKENVRNNRPTTSLGKFCFSVREHHKKLFMPIWQNKFEWWNFKDGKATRPSKVHRNWIKIYLRLIHSATGVICDISLNPLTHFRSHFSNPHDANQARTKNCWTAFKINLFATQKTTINQKFTH